MFELFSENSAVVLGRLVLASFLGGIIGLERDMHGRAAGIRTNMLVCLGSALFMIISGQIAFDFTEDGGGRFADPGRIAAQIIAGIGFLGAGTIIKEGVSVKGLTTAACLWLVAGIGMAVGDGLYFLAVSVTILGVICLVFLKHIEKWYPRDSYRTLLIETDNEINFTDIVNTVSEHKSIKILYFDFERNYETGTTIIKLSIRLFHKGITDKLSHGIIQSFKNANISLKRLKWDHQS